MRRDLASEAKGVVDRELDPFGLALKGGIWYLVARAGGKARTYRISNIQTLDVLGESFTRPRDFKLAAYWKAWASEFEARLYTGKARVKVTAGGMKRLCALSPAISDMATRTGTAADRGGWRAADIPIESIDHAVVQLLQLGGEVEVLAPPALREKIAALAAALNARYARSPRKRDVKGGER